MEKIKGSAEILSSLQLTEDMQGLDDQSKALLRHKEVLANILKGVVREYEKYTKEEIMEFIESDSITSKEVSPGRTNSVITGEHTEFQTLNEKTSSFDICFRTKNPILSGDVMVNLHVDIEPQKEYRPGYPIEKRGIYYLARSISSQLSVALESTDYSDIEKCYSIWICRDNIPRREQYSISFYEMANTANIGSVSPKKEDYDLTSLVVIRLGDEECKSDNELLDFLNILFYPHRKDFMTRITKFIDFKDNDELRQEVSGMSGLGQSILEEGLERGLERGLEEGLERGLEKGLEEGLEKGDARRLTRSVEAAAAKLGSVEKACELLDITMEDYIRARERSSGEQ